MSEREKHLEELKRARAEKDRLIRGESIVSEPVEAIVAPKPKKKKKKIIPIPEPEVIPTYLPTDEVLEIIDAGIMDEIALTPEEKKAIKIQQLQSKLTAIEEE